MTKQLVKSIVGAMALTGVAQAADVVSEAPVNVGDWSSRLKSIGKIYSNKSNPFIQEVKVFGRAQYQWGYVSGKSAKGDFSGNGEDFRRLRIGSSVKFLNKFELKGYINLVSSANRFRQPEFAFDTVDALALTYMFDDVAGFSDLSLGYGRYKHIVTQEAHLSSKVIKTLERSNISNFFFGSSFPTGFQLRGSKSGYDMILGVYSTDEHNDTRRKPIGSWNDGIAYYFNVQHAGWNLDLFYNDAETGKGEDDIFGYQWLSSLAYNTKVGGWELMVNGLFGNIHNGDHIYGLVVMPSKFIIDDKLEAVFRYQFAASSGDNLKATGRDIGRVVKKEDSVKIGKGDRNHTFFAGLNYYFNGHKSKLMAGVEYEMFDGSAENVDAVTLLTGYRMYF